MNLIELPGIGPKSEQSLNRLGIYTPSDLITYYPFRYNIYKRSIIEELDDNDQIIIDGMIESIPSLIFFGTKNKMTFKINTNKNLFTVSIFNRGYLKNKLLIGSWVTVIGKIDKKKNIIIASDIKLSKLPEIPVIEPVYHSNYQLASSKIKSYIEKALEKNIEIFDYIPDEYIKKYNLIDKNKAIKEIHNPKDKTNLQKSLYRLKYEELFQFMIKINYLKLNNNFSYGLKREIKKEKIQEFISNLPFKLTEDQIKCVDDIYNDLISEKRMNRLIQGDVGSGKTIVSIIAMYINFLSGYQSALMAPTEILASQHYKNIKNIFKNHKINIELLTGTLKVKEKKEIYKNLKEENIDIIIGTHALFQDDVEYSNLGLVITDEQHRFGVNQRANLKNKGIVPDILYMSATPIPRTYALTIYGDMDVSNIKVMPNGRKEIKTFVKTEKEIKEVLSMMLQELKNNHQIYVVAPLIEESDKINLENINELYDKMNKAFGKLYNIGILHGKQDKKIKDEEMQKFIENKTQILVSTTVIEVGVDVPNATMIVIFDSHQFGLSALHQLRGRVGRNNLQSYCILVSNKNTERLKILENTNDGFKISEEDFKLRGSGDLFGVRQSGDMNFQLANLKKDFDILLKAKTDSDEYLKKIDLLNDKKALKYKEILYEAKNLD